MSILFLSKIFKEYERIKNENASLREELEQTRATHDNYLKLQDNHKQLQDHLAQGKIKLNPVILYLISYRKFRIVP